jgi:hypothetical protein
VIPLFAWRYLAAFVAVGGLFYGTYRYGYNERDERAQIEAANAVIAAEALEEVLRDEFRATRRRSQKEIEDGKIEAQRLRADIATGALRLSVPTVGPSCPGGDPASGPTAPRAELAPQAAQDLVAIAADGDQAIRELNACIASYNSVRERLNAERPH